MSKPTVAEVTLRLAAAARHVVEALAPFRSILAPVLRSKLYDLELAVSDFGGLTPPGPAPDPSAVGDDDDAA